MDVICIKDSFLSKCIAPVMVVYLGLASFWSVIDPTPFIVLVGDEEYVTVDESVLCTRF